jgi:predicted GNAT family acetyltransferase
VTALSAPAAVVRRLETADLETVQAMVDAEPFGNAVIAAHLDSGRIADLLAIGQLGAPTAACYAGGTLLPVGGDAAAWTVLAGYLGIRPRACSSIVGAADAMAVLWPALASNWGAARRVYPQQPLLALDQPAAVPPDPHVRPARVDELDRYLPAAAAMFDEELGIAPLSGPMGTSYRSQLAALVRARRVLVRTDAYGDVVFKAELAVVSRHTCQVQGVWVRLDRRGQGIGTAAMAAVVAHGLRLAPSVSLYVNDFNLPARRLYDRLGMRQVGILSTVLF